MSPDDIPNDSNITYYSMDTSGFIDGLVRYYPLENFPSVWSKFDDLIEGDNIMAHDEVLEELKPGGKTGPEDDTVLKWLDDNNRMGIFFRDEDITTEALSIINKYPGWVTETNNVADPYVIATAIVRQAIVVTAENPPRPEQKRINIPKVCTDLHIPCINFTDLIKNESWTF